MAEQTVMADGRVELDPAVDATLGNSWLHNEDLAPVAVSKRTWTTYNYLALWIGMAINVPSWMLASGLIGLGMSWTQAIFTIFLGNLIVLVPMVLISHAGTKYGIPYPVLSRASFGTLGANVPAIIRALVACGWFGIQTWVGGASLFAVIGALLGKDSFWSTAAVVGGQPWTVWLSFAVFWAINMWIIIAGMEAIKKFEDWAAPFLIVVFLGLMALMVVQAGGFGPVVSTPGTKEGEFWSMFPLSLMGMIAFWSTLSLNMPDFTRFGRSQKEQAVGQALGLPTTMTLFPLVGVLTTSATVVVFGEAVWDPVALTGKLDNPILLIIMLAALALATLTTNVAANVVSPSYDFSNLWPTKISFKMGGIITGILGILLQPWNLLSDPNQYIWGWLGTYGGATGAIAGVLIVDYWLIRKTHLKVADLYRADGSYKYAGGFNWLAIVALVVGIVFAIGGSPVQPILPNGLFDIQILHDLANYSWVVGLVVSGLVYYVLTMAVGRSAVAEQTA